MTENEVGALPSNVGLAAGSVGFTMTVREEILRNRRAAASEILEKDWIDHPYGFYCSDIPNGRGMLCESLSFAKKMIRGCLLQGGDSIKTIQKPTWIWAHEAIPIAVDVDDVEDLLNNSAEDDAEWVDVDELYNFIREWNKKQTDVRFETDYSRVIILDWEKL